MTSRHRAAALVRDAGGVVVGRTRLQKTAYLMGLAGIGYGFSFTLHPPYGPHSDELAQALSEAKAFGLVCEDEAETSWGGRCSTYTFKGDSTPDGWRGSFARAAVAVGSIELELAATAAYLRAVERVRDPWAEAARLKPDKAQDGRLTRARLAYWRLQDLGSLPNLEPVSEGR